MLRRFYPKAHYNTIFDIQFEKLAEEGYKGIMFDIDNTLVPYDVAHPDERIIELFTKLSQLGFKMTLVSNNSKERVYRFNENLKVYAIPMALKPMTRNLKKGMAMMKTDASNTVFVGDQLFTDVWAGNRLGIKTIHVQPIAVKEQFITRIKRSTEKLVFRRYLKTLKKHEKH